MKNNKLVMSKTDPKRLESVKRLSDDVLIQLFYDVSRKQREYIRTIQNQNEDLCLYAEILMERQAARAVKAGQTQLG